MTKSKDFNFSNHVFIKWGKNVTNFQNFVQFEEGEREVKELKYWRLKCI